MNHRQEVRIRHISPIRVWFGSTAWHPQPQWMMEVFDIEKRARRDYAMSGLFSPLLPTERQAKEWFRTIGGDPK
jgi:hypothetical protein